VTGFIVALCLTVAQLEMQANPRANDEEASAVAEAPDTRGASTQSQPAKSPTPRIPRPSLSLTFPVQIPAERVYLAQATDQAGTAPSVQKSSKKKWLIIIAAAAAGITTVVLLTQKEDKPEAVITLGQPMVGQP
jgi:hypothetical protein